MSNIFSATAQETGIIRVNGVEIEVEGDVNVLDAIKHALRNAGLSAALATRSDGTPITHDDARSLTMGEVGNVVLTTKDQVA